MTVRFYQAVIHSSDNIILCSCGHKHRTWEAAEKCCPKFAKRLGIHRKSFTVAEFWLTVTKVKKSELTS